MDARLAHLSYDLVGEVGVPVVRLHGLTSSRATDEASGIGLTRLLSPVRLLTYDARGHGLSGESVVGTYDGAATAGTTRLAGAGAGPSGVRSTSASGALANQPPDPWDPTSYTWPELARDLLTFLDHFFPGEQVVGIGTSMGVGTLLHGALRDPDRFSRLFLVTPPTAWESRRRKAREYRARAALIESIPSDEPLPAGPAPAPPPARAGAPETEPDIPRLLMPTVLRGAADSDLPALADLAHIHIPVGILAWDGDEGHPLEVAHKLAATFPQAELNIAETPQDVTAWAEWIRQRIA